MPTSAEDSIATYLEEQARLFRKLAKKVHRQPEAERVHKLRVCTRRIRAVLWMLRQEPGGARWKKAARHFKQLGKDLGERRELDVMEISAEQFRLNPSPLRKRIKQAGKKIHRETRRSRRRRLMGHLKEMKRFLGREDGLALEPLLNPLAASLREWHGHSISLQDFHEFRIAVKKVRYLLEALGQDAKPLKSLQEDLGQAHDLAVLQEELGASEEVSRDLQRAFSRGKKGQQPALRFSEESLARLRSNHLPN